MAVPSFDYLSFEVVDGSYIPFIPNPNTAGSFRAIAGFQTLVDIRGPSTIISVVEELTVKYFQRVYDIDNTQWCYYTKTSIDATPGTSETSPTNSGNIISASIVQILEIY